MAQSRRILLNFHNVIIFSPLVLLLFLVPTDAGGGLIVTLSSETDPTPKEIPTVNFNGENLSFDYTDDNRDETLIVRTTQETYHGFNTAQVYVSVTNIHRDSQTVDLQVYFNKLTESVSKVYELVENVPYQVTINDFAKVDHVCPDPWVLQIHDEGFPTADYECLRTNEVFRCDSIDKNTCTANKEFTGTHEETRFRDEWQPITKTLSRDTTAKRLELSKIIPDEYRTREKNTKFISAGETKFYRVDIKFPVQTSNEFYIEAVGSIGAYGLLDPFYSSDWGLRKLITINSTEVASNLTNFPFLINFTDTDLQVDAQADGDDILFTNFDNTTKLAHEIEQYDSANGYLTAWVNIPTIDSATDTQIWIYYNNSLASNQENITGTWNDDYILVSHVHDDFLDSTSNNYDGTNTGTSDTPSMVRDGQDWTSSSSDEINYGDINEIEGIAEMTVSMWANSTLTLVDSQDTFYSKGIGCTATQGLEAYIHNSQSNRILFSPTGCNTSRQVSPNPMISGEYSYLTFVYNGTEASTTNRAKIYIDGVRSDNSGSGTISTTSATLGTEFEWGKLTRTGAHSWDGEMDELRVSLVSKSADWIDFEYCNINPNSFINGSGTLCPAWSIGNEEVGAQLPNAPTSLTATPTSQTQIDLDWDHDLLFGTNGFRIDRESPIGGGFSVLVANTTTTITAFNNTGLNCGTQYNYQVAALNENGTSAFSNQANATITCDTVFNALVLKVAAPLTNRLGGVMSLTCTGTDKVSAINASGFPVCTQDDSMGAPSNIHDIGNVTSAGCAEDEVLQVNSSGIWDCANTTIGITLDRIEKLNSDIIIRDKPVDLGNITMRVDGVEVVFMTNNVYELNQDLNITGDNDLELDTSGSIIWETTGGLTTILYDGDALQIWENFGIAMAFSKENVFSQTNLTVNTGQRLGLDGGFGDSYFIQESSGVAKFFNAGILHKKFHSVYGEYQRTEELGPAGPFAMENEMCVFWINQTASPDELMLKCKWSAGTENIFLHSFTLG